MACQIAEIASDVVECSKIAKRVAMKITQGLKVGGIITKDTWAERNTERVGRVPLYGTFMSLSLIKLSWPHSLWYLNQYDTVKLTSGILARVSCTNSRWIRENAGRLR